MANRRSREASGNTLFPTPRTEGLHKPLPNVLIVCEDTKSSSYYIKDYIKDVRLTSANIEVIPGEGSAPRNVVNTVEKYIQKENQAYQFDYVFMVIDRDHHETFDEAVDKFRTLQNNNKKIKFIEAISYPSFEIWVLYHFEYSRSPMEYSKDVIKKIKSHGFDYDKAGMDVFAKTSKDMDVAIANAKKSIGDADAVKSPNPSTNFYLLIEKLRSLKESFSQKKVSQSVIVGRLWEIIATQDKSKDITLEEDVFSSIGNDIFKSDVFLGIVENSRSIFPDHELLIENNCLIIKSLNLTSE